MIYYIYNDTFRGLLSALDMALKAEIKPDKIIRSSSYKENLFASKVIIKNDHLSAQNLYEKIKKRLSSQSLKRIYYCYLSECEDIELLIFNYLELGFKKGKDIEKDLANNIVYDIYNKSRKVGAERHRLLGLLRFKKIRGDLYYATVEPDHDIITLMAPHFASRLADQNWVIHDLKRSKAAFYNKREWVVSTLDEDIGYILAEDEGFYQDLWKHFFEKIAIKNRVNSRLQMQFMPKKYWKHLIEKE